MKERIETKINILIFVLVFYTITISAAFIKSLTNILPFWYWIQEACVFAIVPLGTLLFTASFFFLLATGEFISRKIASYYENKTHKCNENDLSCE